MRERKPHRLGKNKGNEKPQQVLFFDTETTPVQLSEDLVEHKLKLGSSCYVKYNHKNNTESRSWFDFTTRQEFWEYVASCCHEKKRLIMVSHNLDFDIQVIDGFKALQAKGFHMEYVIINGTTNIWSFASGQKSILLLDNMNYFKMSLAALGESIGVKKLDIDFDNCTDEDLLIYCRRDVEIMCNAWSEWLDFLHVNNLGCWSKSIAGQSLNSFRHRFMINPPLIHTNEQAVQL